MKPTPQGRIVTFYSYKGGTGRSMALANFAWMLASSGKRVLVIDWDLEAPGLHRYFRPFLSDPELVETEGLIDAIWELAGTAVEASQPLTPLSLSPEEEDARVAEALQDATRRLRPIDRPSLDSPAPGAQRKKGAARPAQPQLFASGGSIDLIGAGRQGSTYSARVNTFAWQRFFELDGARLLESAKRYLRNTYDWVLIDSRTGVSDTAGICTIQLPDTVVACFTPNRQSVAGVSDVLHSIRSYQSGAIDGSAIRFFPLATRIENLEPRKLEASRAYFRGRLAEFLPEQFRARAREYWDSMEIPYKTGYAFEELLAAFGDATGALGSADTMLSHMERAGQIIAENPDLAVAEIGEAERETVLARYALDEAARIGSPDPMSIPSPSDEQENEVLRNVRAKEQIWRTRGFNWRHLMSAREMDLLTEQDRASFGRNMAFYLNNSTRMRNFVRSTDRAFLICWIIPIAMSGIYYFLKVQDIKSRYSPEALSFSSYDSAVFQVFQLSALSILILYPLCLAVVSLLYSRLPDKPYGMRLAEVTLKIVLGPLRSEVRDYESIQHDAERQGRPFIR